MQRNRLVIHRGVWVYDPWILFPFLALALYGLVMVASASMVISDKQFHYPLHFFLHQLTYFVLGLMGMHWISRSNLKRWERAAPVLMLLSIVLLIAVLVPGIGRVVNGSRRWIHLGPFSLQVSEFVKLFGVLYLASYLDRYRDAVKQDLLAFAKPLLVLGVMALLLLLQPNFGSVAVLTVTFLMVLFVADVKLWPFVVLLIFAAAALAAVAVMSPYRLARLTSFINPWAHQYGSGYQLTQSLIAFGRGGLVGVGLGNSVAKLNYLPEAHTDFLFAVIGEELGLLGELLLIALFVILIARLFLLARRAFACQYYFGGFLLFGFAVWVSLQAVINMGVNSGLLPTKGLTLPFISYGGSSMLVSCAIIGFTLKMSCEVVWLEKDALLRQSKRMRKGAA